MTFTVATHLFQALTVLTFVRTMYSAPRHIVFIIADDLGWNDVGFHNPDMITPNIDELAHQGVILNSSYVQPVCTPSRHAWMTGVYPFKSGLQRAALFARTAECSPLNLEYLPQRLKKLGYATHMIGKWHLGYCNWNCTPTYRGFDSFLGYYHGKEDYYTKDSAGGVDFHLNEKPLNDTSGTYSAFVYAERAKHVIQTHDKTKPLFLYLPFQSVHSPIQVPARFENMYPHVKTEQRRQYCGMVSAMDEAIGNVTNALKKADMMKDTLIIFTSDNGGWPKFSGNNFPLRGGKITVFEGGTRATAFISGAGLEKNKYTYNGMIHAVDWHPTIVAAAGGDSDSQIQTNIDGINLWDSLRTGTNSSRNEFVYNLDNAIGPLAVNGHAAIRVGDFKLIDGYPGPYPDWYQPDTEYEDSSFPTFADSEYSPPQPHEYAWTDEFPWKGDGLYNLKEDPTEHHDISHQFPEVVRELRKKLNEYRKSLVPPKPQIPDPKSNPKNYGGYWMPGWC